MQSITSLPEYGVYGEARYGCARYHGEKSSKILQDILSIIRNGSFPQNRENLSEWYRRMLRDAISLQTHPTDKRYIFITNDERAFIKNELRQKLENKFNIEILTREEFIRNNS